MSERPSNGERRWEGEMFRLLVENVKDYAIFLIGPDHRVLSWSRGAEHVLGYREEEIVGQPIDCFFTPEDRERGHPAKEMTQALTTGRGEDDRWHVRKDGTRFWSNGVMTPLYDETGVLRGFAKIMRDRTDFKRAEEARLERARLERLRNARLAVTQVLAQAESIPEAASGVLRAVCESLGWELGFFWLLDPLAQVLRCQASWHVLEQSFDQFETASRQRIFKKGEGLPGHLWSLGKPHWLLDCTKETNFPRAAMAAQDGLCSAFGCPIVVGQETLGVIEFFTKQLREPDEELLEMMGTVAGQMGHFLERKRTEEALRDSEEKFRAMADTIPQLAWMAHADGHIFWYNRRWYEYTGTTPEEMVGWGWQSVHDPATLPKVMDRWKASLASGQFFDMVFPLRGADGVFRPFLTRVIPARDATGAIRYWFGTNTDISAQQHAADAARFLADASATLAAVVDYESTLHKVARCAVPFFADWCTVHMAEPDGTLRPLALVHRDPSKIEWAKELSRRYPPRPELPYGPYQVLRTAQPQLVSEIAEDMLANSARDEEHLRILRELNLRSFIAVPLITRGKAIGVLTFITSDSGRHYSDADLTLARDLALRASVAIDNARLYQELREADRLKDEFLAMLAHELRNPLAPVRNALHVMKQPDATDAMIRDSQDMAERQAQHMARLLDDLLDMSRISRGRIELRKEAIDVTTVVRRSVETVSSLFKERKQQLTVTLPPTALYVDADPTRLEQILTNLLNNAAKYTDPGGMIWLKAEREGNDVVLRVRDTGIGIEADMLPRIFDLFVQAERRVDRAQGGVGIGLTLVKKLVELHGGWIQAVSPGPGEGSEFIVRLPARVAPPLGVHSLAEKKPIAAAYPRRRVLIVDDNRDAADSLALLLKLSGQDVDVAYDGASGLTRAREFLPQLVFLDIGMPGMDGYAVARQLREQHTSPNLLLVAVTGWGQDEDRRRSIAAGFDDHMVKPAEPQVLRRFLSHPKLDQNA